MIELGDNSIPKIPSELVKLGGNSIPKIPSESDEIRRRGGD